MKEIDKEEQVVLSVVLLLITMLCLGFSFWSMMGGYESLVGGIYASAAMSFAIALMLFAVNYSLRRGLIQGISNAKITGLLVLYIFIVMISFSGLFNKFYSTFMHKELVNEELSQKIYSLTTLKETAISELSNVEATKLVDDVLQKVDQLEFQIKSTSEPGLGKKANGLLDELEKMLGTTIQREPHTSTSTKALDELSKKYREMILGNKEKGTIGILDRSTKLAELNSGDKRSYLKEIPKIIDPEISNLIAKKSDYAAKSDNETKDNAIEAIQKAVIVYNQVSQKVKSLIKEKEFIYETDMKVKNDEIGKIDHSYRSASEHMSSPGVWISAFIALAIDLIVPLFVFFLTPRGQQIGKRNISNKNKARVLEDKF